MHIMGNYKLRESRYFGHSVNDTIPSAVGVPNFRRIDTNTNIMYISDGTQWLSVSGGTQVPKEKLPTDTTYNTTAQTLTSKTISGAAIADATNIDLGSTTGTKIGTATTQKLGFFNAAPVTQRPANANTSGATLVALETEVNELKQLLRDYGLLA